MEQWSTLKKLIWLYAVKLKGGASAIIETITGNLPLVLQNAIQHSIKSLTRYGLCTQDGTPTPEAPVDIMTNNGALKWDSVNQRVYADGTPEVLTVGGPNLLNAATNITGKYITANGSISNGNDSQYTDLIPVKAGETYVASFVSGRNSGTNRWHGYNANGGWVMQLAYVGSQQGNKLSMGATIDSGISYVRLSYGINDTEAMVVGTILSDSIADKFYEGEMSSNKGKLRSLTEIQSPYTSSASNRCPATMYSVIPGRSYIVANNVPPATNVYTGFYASVDDVTTLSKAVGNASGSLFVVPAGANYAVTVYLKFVSGTTYTFDKPMVSEFHTPDYQPYVEPQTASVPMLLSVGDVKDEAELISGHADRAITVFRVSPDLNWLLASGTGYKQFYTSDTQGQLKSSVSCMSNIAPYGCTASNRASYQFGCYTGSTGNLCFQMIGEASISTVADWQNFLRDNVVYVVAAKATATTEHITAQNLVTNEGTNIVDSVANVSPLEAEVEYYASA